MGCHTWFSNKISDIPSEDVEVLRERCVREIEGAWIYRTPRGEFIASIKRDLEDEIKNDGDKMWIDSLTKMSDPKYYDKKIRSYKRDIKILKDKNAKIRDVLRVLSKHMILFNKNLENGYYDLGYLGYGDNYRVHGYPEEVFYDAETAIKFLENYPQKMISSGMGKEGMCDEIRNIITEFFKKYPKGKISYG